jgi:poly-beta-1,6-N-acetyl-D-glucosamine synthase
VTLSYGVVTPVHNEAENLPRLVACMAAQTVPARLWVLVENGSTDDTLAVATELAREHSWIRVVSMPPIAASERGAPIVHAFHHGLDELDSSLAVVAQLDADISFPPMYFETLLRELDADPRLGIVSGRCHEQVGNEWQPRHLTGVNVWGAARAYRSECLEHLLPLEPRTGWDAVDVAEANALGWKTRTLPALAFRHHRREAERERTLWSAWAAQGRVSRYVGYRPSYLVLRAVFRAVREPASLGLLAGYFGDAIRRRPRCSKPGVIAWVREQQRLRHVLRRAREARGTV